MSEISRVLAITPVWNETLGMIQAFRDDIQKVRGEFLSRNIGFSHMFLDDDAPHLPAEFPRLIRHKKNQGLAETLLDGYTEALDWRDAPDIIIRLDCQEHDAGVLPRIVEHMKHSRMEAIFLPVWYSVEGQACPPMREICRLIANFADALSPIDERIVLETYNQKFPMGFQAYNTRLLGTILPDLKKGMKICEEITQQPTSWGLDLLAIMLAAREEPERIDFLFGGWSTPWQENRGPDKIKAQEERAKTMIEVMRRL